MSNTMDYDRRPNGVWGPPAWPRHGWHPLGVLGMVLGFIFWWPVGLAILFYMLWSRSMCGYGDRFEHKMERMQAKMDHFRSRMGGGGFPRWEGRSSGNRAFDDYRSETLKRLEDEQSEFKDFLNRLRHAKDKAEFDQFMADRRNRPSSPPQDQPSA